jgi:transcriptional regulator with XRE-family HTH domain
MSNESTRRSDPSFDYARARRVVRPRKGRERVSLRTAREGLGLSQAEVARALGTDQGEVSRIERRGNVRLSTLCKYAEALGARCDVTFVFPNGQHVLIDVKTEEEPPK